MTTPDLTRLTSIATGAAEADPFEPSDAAYLRQVRDLLAPLGLFGPYLRARRLVETTTYRQIARAEGRPYTNRTVSS